METVIEPQAGAEGHCTIYIWVEVIIKVKCREAHTLHIVIVYLSVKRISSIAIVFLRLILYPSASSETRTLLNSEYLDCRSQSCRSIVIRALPNFVSRWILSSPI